MLAGPGCQSTFAFGLWLFVLASCGETSRSWPVLAMGGYSGEADGMSAGGAEPSTAAGGAGAAAGEYTEAGAAVSAAGANSEPPEPGFLLHEGPASRVAVVSDRTGNAMVQWNAGTDDVHFARWLATEQRWLYPSAVVLDEAFVVDTLGSGHALLIGNTVEPGADESTTVVHRFDAETNAWGAARPTGIQGSFVHLHALSMDGAGNAYAHWGDDDGLTRHWTWWPVGATAWEPTQTIARVSGIVGRHDEGAWLWQENAGFGVRAFDLGAGAWGDEHEILPLGSSTGIHYVVVGRSGEALASTLRHYPTELVMEVSRYDPELGAWQPNENALQAATDGDPNRTFGPPLPITDRLHHDIVAIPVPVADELKLEVSRRDPASGAWASLRTFEGLEHPHEIELVADASGNLFGHAPPSTLLWYESATDSWTDTSVEKLDFTIVASRKGAFALGTTFDQAIVYRHLGAGGEWRRVGRFGTAGDVGPVQFAIAALAGDQAVVVWPSRDGVRAAFVE